MNQIILEILNAALYDLTKGTPNDGIEAIEEAIQLLEQQGEKIGSLLDKAYAALANEDCLDIDDARGFTAEAKALIEHDFGATA